MSTTAYVPWRDTDRASRAWRAAEARALALGRQLPPADWRVLHGLAGLLLPHAWAMAPLSAARIAQAAGTDVRTTRRALARLAEAGVIIRRAPHPNAPSSAARRTGFPVPRRPDLPAYATAGCSCPVGAPPSCDPAAPCCPGCTVRHLHAEVAALYDEHDRGGLGPLWAVEHADQLQLLAATLRARWHSAATAPPAPPRHIMGWWEAAGCPRPWLDGQQTPGSGPAHTPPQDRAHA